MLGSNMSVIKPPWQLLLVTDYYTQLNLDQISDFLIALILSFSQKLLKKSFKTWKLHLKDV